MRKTKGVAVANCTHKPVLTYGPSNFLSVDVGSFIEVLCLKVSKCLGVLLGHSFLPSFGPGKLPNVPGVFRPKEFLKFQKVVSPTASSHLGSGNPRNALGSTLQLLLLL